MFYLIRSFESNLNEKKNEDFFSNIFFDKDGLKKINYFFALDSWKKSSIKEMAKYLKKEKTGKDNYFVFKKWNWNIEYLYKELPIVLNEYDYKWNKDIIFNLKEKDFLTSYAIFKELSEEEKFGTLIKMAIYFNKPDFFKKINESVNENYLSLLQVYNLIIFDIFKMM